jgi:hypothetical protein
VIGAEHDPAKLVLGLDPGMDTAKPSSHPFVRLDASAGEGRSGKIMLKRFRRRATTIRRLGAAMLARL